MKKTFFQFLLSVLLFFSTWFLLSRVDWVELLRIRKVSAAVQERLGTIFWDAYSKTEAEVRSDSCRRMLDTLLLPILEKNRIDRHTLKLHLVRNTEVNAFAFPGDHLVIFTGLVEACHNKEEFLGVVCHELAHIQKKHVMKKLVKELGLTVILSVSTGSSGGQVAEHAIKLLSSTAYDRKMEREADLAAVDFMLKSGVDPRPYATFLNRLSSNEKNVSEQYLWISTHPDSRERAVSVLKYISGRAPANALRQDNQQWNRFRQAVAKQQ